MSSGVNRYIGIGNLCKDPDLRYTPNEVAVCAVNVAFTTKRGKNEDTQFLRCKFFNRLAEIASEYLKKGDKIYVMGRISVNQWEKDGVKNSITEVLVDELQMLGSPKASNEQRQEPPQDSGTGPEDPLPF